MRRKKSPILDAVLTTAKGLHAAGAIDQVTMREFDTLALQPVPPPLTLTRFDPPVLT
jgi:putative transcriptional regulator